jgi:hypothetical protein
VWSDDSGGILRPVAGNEAPVLVLLSDELGLLGRAVEVTDSVKCLNPSDNMCGDDVPSKYPLPVLTTTSRRKVRIPRLVGSDVCDKWCPRARSGGTEIENESRLVALLTLVKFSGAVEYVTGVCLLHSQK